jgi:hypothetical protein
MHFSFVKGSTSCLAGKHELDIYHHPCLKPLLNGISILPNGFTIVASGLNVQAHTEDEFNRAIDALEAGLGIFTAEECDVILLGGITLGTQRGYRIEQEVVAKLSERVGLPISTGMNASVSA